jgi:hypothetical protein
MGCIHPGPKGQPRRPPPPKATDKVILDRIERSPATVSTTIGSTTLRYAYLSQRGTWGGLACFSNRGFSGFWGGGGDVLMLGEREGGMEGGEIKSSIYV